MSENLPAVPVQHPLVRLSRAVPPVVWKGLAMVAAGKAVEWGARVAARRMVAAAPGALSALLGRASTGELPGPTRPDLGTSVGGVVAETIILLRRIHIVPGPAGAGKRS